MKHASPNALDKLEPLLVQLRQREGLKEKSRGVFYRGGRAFLHFHEHGEELFADMRLGEDFERFPTTGAPERRRLLARVDAALADGSRLRRR
jgi:hypothetical protein